MAYVRLDWKGRVITEGAMPPTDKDRGGGISTMILLAIAAAIGLALFGGKK